MKNKKLKFIKKIFAVILSALVIVLAGCGVSTPITQNSNSAVWDVVNSMQTDDDYIIQSKTDEYRAVWISYLEWESIDTSTEQSFTNAVTQMFDNAKSTGLNTVIVQVRPFGDAMYQSDIFPYSHLLTGTQGQNPGYDPLAIMTTLAHDRSLKIEAWINPYRVQLTASKPQQLSSNNPAVEYMQNTETENYVLSANGGLYYNPAIPEVQTLICDGVIELMQNYNVDGIIFDDYFYPEGIDEQFDANEYASLGQGMALADWRRQNVNSLISMVYSAVKQQNNNVTFAISPQGNNDNNYNSQYSDIGLWLANDGYVDAVIPQIYWGYNFATQSGNTRFGFENCLQEWAQLPRSENVNLYIALGAFRIGNGDNSSIASDEWQTGNNLAEMIKSLRNLGINGFSLYRYNDLFNNTVYPELAQSETEAVKQLMQ